MHYTEVSSCIIGTRGRQSHHSLGHKALTCEAKGLSYSGDVCHAGLAIRGPLLPRPDLEACRDEA